MTPIDTRNCGNECGETIQSTDWIARRGESGKRQNLLPVTPLFDATLLTSDFVTVKTNVRNRIEIAEKLLNKILLIQCEKPKQDALKRHFNYHAGHCAECYTPLIEAVYPLDTRNTTKNYLKRGKKLTACAKHSKQLNDKKYHINFCECCSVRFIKASGIKSIYCSLACRNYSDYQNTKSTIPKTYKPIIKNKIPCKHCSSNFVPKRIDSIFCSGKCRIAYWRLTRRIIQFEIPMEL